MTSGFCLKCRKKRTMDNLTHTKMKNGRPAMKGNCAICKTKMFKIGKA